MKQTWINWRQIILDDPELSHGAKSMALFLNTYMNDNHDFAFPSIATISGRYNISQTTAIKHLNELEENKYIVKQYRFGRSTVYFSNIPSKITNTPESGILQELKHNTPETVVSILQKLEPNKQENKQSNKQGAFDEFWKLYPRKVNKKAAQRIFNRLSDEKKKKAIAGIKDRFNGTDPQFILYPSTYLNGERWCDEITAPKPIQSMMI